MSRDAYVLVYCDTCGKIAERITRDENAKRANISGVGFDECSKCAKSRRERDRLDSIRAEKERQDRLSAWNDWLAAHGITEDDLRKIMPDEFFGDWDD